MPRSLPRLAGLLVCGILMFGCGGDSSVSTPTAPTPPVTTTPPPSPPPPPAEPAALASLTLSTSSVTGQGSPEATVTLTAAAPAAGAVVALSSANSDIAKVPSTVTVAAGSTSNTFRVDTSTVPVDATVTITATYAEVSKTASLTVLAPALEPRFTVTSTNRGADACDIINSAGGLECRFDASASGGFVAKYMWTMKLGGSETSFSAGDGQAVVTPSSNCGFLGNGTQQDGKVPMEVSLQLEDRGGKKSDTVRRTISVYHNSRCGY